ncbi:MAG TPA: two-component regulator propeller domain-containing protein [Blastocatellia bacterium]|nr:two-component regulator propeller domain-containing protein [Blastocatellia bacterium]
MRIARHLGELSLAAFLLSLPGCSATVSSDLRNETVNPGQGKLAGHQVLKWYKVDESAFPGAIFQDESARYWVGNGVGLSNYDESQNIWTNIGLEALGWRTCDIKQIAQSSDRRLWIRSTPLLFDNIRVFDGKRWSSVQRLAASRVATIFSGASGKLWFAVGGELMAYEHGGWSLRLRVSDLVKNPKLSYIFSINTGLEDRNGLIWLAARDGIITLMPGTSKQTHYFEDENLAHVRCMYEDNMESVWVGSYEGSVSFYDRTKSSWRNYDLSKQVALGSQKGGHDRLTLSVNAIQQDKSGLLLIATTRGLVTVDGMGNKWQAFTHDNSLLPEGSITTMMQDKYGRIWIGTGEGILVLGE